MNASALVPLAAKKVENSAVEGRFLEVQYKEGGVCRRSVIGRCPATPR